MREPLKAVEIWGPPEGGSTYSNSMVQLIEPAVFLFLLLDVSRMTVSSLPTVDTKYPLAQKCCPVKLRLRPPKVLAIWMALLPLMKPTTCATEYLGGIETSM